MMNNYNTNMDIEIDSERQLAEGVAEMLNNRNIPNHQFSAVPDGNRYAIRVVTPGQAFSHFQIRDYANGNFFILDNNQIRQGSRVTSLNEAANFVQRHI